MKIAAAAGGTVIEVQIERTDGGFLVEVDGRRFVVDAHKLEDDFYSILTEGRSYEVSVEPRRDGYFVRHGAAERRVILTDPGRRARAEHGVGAGPAEILSQMPGRVVRVLAEVGDRVEADQGLVVIEAMKMENEITAPKAGTVTRIAVTPGQTVESGTVLAVVE